MIENMERLLPEHKLFMIFNTDSFSNSTKVSIDFYRSSWYQELEETQSVNTILEMEKNSIALWNNIFIHTEDFNIPKEVSVFMDRFFKEVKSMPSETKEQMKEIILYFRYAFDFLMENKVHFTKNPEYFKKQIELFFKKALPSKVTAFEIMHSLNEDIRPADENKYLFYSKELRILIEEFMMNTSVPYSAFVIYLICKLLDSEGKGLYNILVDSKSAMFDMGHDELEKCVISLLNGDTSAMNMIDLVKDEDISQWTKNIIETGKNLLTRNYEKKKICDRINHGGLVIGDNVFNDKVSINELIIELDKLSKDHIKDYIGENHMIDFFIDERQSGFIKENKKLPLCKVLMPDGKFFTIIKYNSESYLLFTVSGDTSLYGISFPSGYQGNRKLIKFEIAYNLDYKLEI